MTRFIYTSIKSFGGASYTISSNYVRKEIDFYSVKWLQKHKK